MNSKLILRSIVSFFFFSISWRFSIMLTIHLIGMFFYTDDLVLLITFSLWQTVLCFSFFQYKNYIFNEPSCVFLQFLKIFSKLFNTFHTKYLKIWCPQEQNIKLWVMFIRAKYDELFDKQKTKSQTNENIKEIHF